MAKAEALKDHDIGSCIKLSKGREVSIFTGPDTCIHIFFTSSEGMMTKIVVSADAAIALRDLLNHKDLV